MLNEKVSQLIDSYQEDMTKMLARWVRVPSVKGEDVEDGAPFGAQMKRMLDMAMVDAETMGFITHGYDGYACDFDLGDAPETLAVLAHLDVVPAGEGWRMDPFGAVMEGDKMYGRGTSDDKGPAIAALFAMRAIKEAGIPLKRTIRMILGCDEECGSSDMHYYQEQKGLPEMGFSPDASFPIINTEKAMVQMMVHAPLSAEGLQVKSFYVGERLNVIAGEASAVVSGGAEIVEKTAAYAQKTGLPYTAEMVEDGVRLFAQGIPGHSAYPKGCRSAIGMMLLLLKELGAEGAIKTLADKVGLESNGASLGCACADEITGHLTCNMGILHVENGQVTASLDMRCPIDADLKHLKENALSNLKGFTASHVQLTQAHHVAPESELVSQLLAAYAEETGNEAKPHSTGGGTYAKEMKMGVAFGAAFPGDEDLAHQANEYIAISKLVKASKIFANALLRLCAL